MTMTPSEIAALEAALRSAACYLEYGAGDSTKLAARIGSLASISSVESDPVFSQSVCRDEQVAACWRAGRLKCLLVDIGPTGAWGRPRDLSKAYLWPNYALCPYLHGYRPDLILIDGRFRVACGLVAALAAPEATVLIHDYPGRPYYHILEEFFAVEETVDTLVRMKRKPAIDERRAQQMLASFVYNPNDWVPYYGEAKSA